MSTSDGHQISSWGLLGLSLYVRSDSVRTESLEKLLEVAHVVTHHVPETPMTRNMIGAKELSVMRKGSFLVNASRGSVVDIPALVDALNAGHVLGAALDVFPEEPASNSDSFISELQQFDSVILSPHIGGSTLEAQENIALEVSGKLVGLSAGRVAGRPVVGIEGVAFDGEPYRRAAEAVAVGEPLDVLRLCPRRHHP
jgi:phosphoglycerate dehydrogenase-like enzyme